MDLDPYPEMKRILEQYGEIESKPSDDRVGSTQIEQNQRELDRYPATKRIREIESKPSDDRVGSMQIEPNQRELEHYPAIREIKSKPSYRHSLRRILEEYREIQSNPSDDFKCGMLERNPYEWQFGIRGARGTEFEGGIYHGWIQFPKEYPFKRPSFTILTENGRFKTQNKIKITRLNDWQQSWRVRDALHALIDEMPTYPDGELGSVEYNKEERRGLAIKSRAAAPKYGTSERQKIIDDIHKYLLSKSPPVPQLCPSQASNGTGGGYVVNVSGNIFHATNSTGVGILGSMNEFSEEGHKPKKLKLSWPKLPWLRKQN